MSSLPRLLIVGLGNISLPGTRHSVGHTVVDALAASRGLRMSPTRDGFLAEGAVELNQENWLLTFFKPKPLMNILGPTVLSTLRTTSPALPPTRMLIVHDDLRLPSLTLKSSFRDKPNGHGGVKSVTAALGGDSGFHRLRIGVGQTEGADARTYVLGRLSQHEKMYWGGEGVEEVWREVGKVVRRIVKEEEAKPRAGGGP